MALDPEKKAKALENFELKKLFEADSSQELAPGEAFEQRTMVNRTEAIVRCTNNILQFFSLCEQEYGLSRIETIKAIELATLIAYNAPSGLSPDAINKARDQAFKYFTATKNEGANTQTSAKPKEKRR